MATDPRDQRIAELEKLVAKLMARVEEQDARIAELEAQLRQSSRNSSKPPPSSDPPGTSRPLSTPTGRSPGGQPGHKGTKRELLPVQQVDSLIPVQPDTCERCHGALAAGKDAPAPVRHQV